MPTGCINQYKLVFCAGLSNRHTIKMQIKTSYKSAVLLAAAVSLGSGCSTWFSSDFAPPQVQLVDAEVVRARLVEQQFSLRFRIDNPNQHNLPLRGIEYQVELNEIALGQGTSNKWKTVPANGHSFYEVTIYTNLWRQIRDLVRMLETPDQPVNYSLQVRLKSGFLHGKNVDLSHQGSITPGYYLGN